MQIVSDRIVAYMKQNSVTLASRVEVQLAKIYTVNDMI